MTYYRYIEPGWPPGGRRRRLVAWLAVAGVLVAVIAVVVVRPTVLDWYWSATAPPSCGSVRLGENDFLLVSGSPNAELCFVHAARTCTPRSLAYATMGLDTGSTQDLRVVRSSGACRVLDRATTYVDVFPPDMVELDCSSAPRWDGSGWVLACGSSGTVTLAWPRSNPQGPIRPIPEPSPVD